MSVHEVCNDGAAREVGPLGQDLVHVPVWRGASWTGGLRPETVRNAGRPRAHGGHGKVREHPVDSVRLLTNVLKGQDGTAQRWHVWCAEQGDKDAEVAAEKSSFGFATLDHAKGPGLAQGTHGAT